MRLTPSTSYDSPSRGVGSYTNAVTTFPAVVGVYVIVGLRRASWMPPSLPRITASFIPIFWRSVDTLTGDSTTAVVPFFFRKASPEKSVTAITPLVWRYETVESSTTVAFPLVFDQHYSQESRTTGVLPFYIRHKNWPLEGMQYHPESFLTQEGERLLANFLKK